MRHLKPVLAGLAFLLAACSSGSPGAGSSGDLSGIVYWTYYDTAYSPTDIAYAGGSGQLATQILGNPFSVSQDQFDKLVTDAMYGAHFGPATHFSVAPRGDFKRIFYVRLAFDSSAPININTICVAPPEPPQSKPQSNGSVRISAAFCQSGQVLSYLEAGGSGYSGADDPRFAQFIKLVTFNLFPPQNSGLQRGQPGNCMWPSC
jgi:hypothetical protein